MTALAAGDPTALQSVPGINASIVAAATTASEWAYARAYNVAWASISPFVVLAIVCIACLKGVRELMTDHIEATVEKFRHGSEEESSGTESKEQSEMPKEDK